MKVVPLNHDFSPKPVISVNLNIFSFVVKKTFSNFNCQLKYNCIPVNIVNRQ